MYRIGHRKKRIRHHVAILSSIILVVIAITSVSIWFLLFRNVKTELKQVAPTTQNFDPSSAEENIKIDAALYTMELPKDWKLIATNKDDRYTSMQWQLQTGIKNRWIELFTDRIPADMAFNKVIPITISQNTISTEAESDNCIKFTPKSETSLKVQSKWQDAPFLCDFSNWNDNIVGVSEKQKGVIFELTGAQKGTHTYMIVYTDRGVPEDLAPITTALNSLRAK